MERRSRSTTRNGGGSHYHHHSGYAPGQQSGGSAFAPRQSSARSFGGDPAVPPPSLAHRPGGDSRTLSPDRRNSRHLELSLGANVGGYGAKSSSYNPYTMQQPPSSLIVNGLNGHHRDQQQPPMHPPRSSLPHLSPPPPLPPTSSGGVAARPPAASPPGRTTSTPQSTPVRYEDFAEGLNNSMRQQGLRRPRNNSRLCRRKCQWKPDHSGKNKTAMPEHFSIWRKKLGTELVRAFPF